MNSKVKSLFIFVLGVGSGFAGSALFFKKKFEKKADKEIADMERYFNERSSQESAFKDIVDLKPGEVPVKDRPTPTHMPETMQKDIDMTNKRAAAAYYDYTSRYSTTPDTIKEYCENDVVATEAVFNEKMGDFMDGAEATAEHAANLKREPKIIKAEDFGIDPMYTCETLYFYQDDGVLATDNDDEIIGNNNTDFDEVEALIGSALDKYGFRDNDEGAIYVRNFARNTDYEIIKIQGHHPDNDVS